MDFVFFTPPKEKKKGRIECEAEAPIANKAHLVFLFPSILFSFVSKHYFEEPSRREKRTDSKNQKKRVIPFLFATHKATKHFELKHQTNKRNEAHRTESSQGLFLTDSETTFYNRPTDDPYLLLVRITQSFIPSFPYLILFIR